MTSTAAKGSVTFRTLAALTLGFHAWDDLGVIAAVLGGAALLCTGLAAATGRRRVAARWPAAPAAATRTSPPPATAATTSSHYDLNLRYDAGDQGARRGREPRRQRPRRRCAASTSTCATSRSRAVTVNGRAATFAHADGELVVTPRSARCRRAGRSSSTVAYGGTTGQPEDNTGALYGWVSYDDGAFVANEPEGASTWYPVNDVPYDKATYSFDDHRARRARPRSATASWSRKRTKAGWTTWRWVARRTRWPATSRWPRPANYTLTTSRTPSGLPIINAVDNDLTAAPKARRRTRASPSSRR